MTEFFHGENEARRSFDWQAYQREYRRKNPEKVQQWKINQAVNMLRRFGYTVIAPLNGEDTPA